MTDDRHISLEELTLLAMQALSDEETAAMRLHLSECAECREELARIHGDMAVLAVGVAQHPLPEGARERFVERVMASAASAQSGTEARDIAVPPASAVPASGPGETPLTETSIPEKRVVSISGVRESRGPEAPGVRSVPFAGILPDHEVGTDETEVEEERSGETRRRSMLWISWTAMAALLILCALLGLRVHRLNWRVQSAEARLQKQRALIQKQTAENLRARAVLDAMTAPSAQHVLLTSGPTQPAPSARAVYLAFRGAFILQASNMRQLPANKTYEAWVIPVKGDPIPAGMFRPDSSGSGSVVLPEIPVGIAAKGFGITIEKTGGSNAPSFPIILFGAAPAGGE